MEPFFAIADLFSRTALHGKAYSALPDAPVLPVRERPARLARAAAYLRGRVRAPDVTIRRARYSQECTTT